MYTYVFYFYVWKFILKIWFTEALAAIKDDVPPPPSIRRAKREDPFSTEERRIAGVSNPTLNKNMKRSYICVEINVFTESNMCIVPWNMFIYKRKERNYSGSSAGDLFVKNLFVYWEQ